jgi:hypothetical protein
MKTVLRQGSQLNLRLFVCAVHTIINNVRHNKLLLFLILQPKQGDDPIAHISLKVLSTGVTLCTSLLSQCDVILSAILLTRTEIIFNLFQLAN